MAIITSQALLPEFVKMRWNEPYVSAGLNRKTFKNTPRGIYSGFVVKAGPGATEITIAHDNPEGYGLVSGFAGGNFDTASGWSMAVHESLQGFNTTIAVLSSSQTNYVFDLVSAVGTTVYPALYVEYGSGLDTTAKIGIYQAVDLEADPTLINMARIDVPSFGSITDANIIYDDPSYPRVLPFATPFKMGFMDKYQVQVLEELQNVSGIPAFFYETVLTVDGPQTIPLPPGAIYTVGASDLWVHKNGNLKNVTRDYLEVDRGDGFGEEIYYLGLAKADDIINLRIQQYATSLVSKTKVLDEGAQINGNTVFFNFSGTGVTVLPDGPSRVKVVIPGGGGSSGGVRSKQNDSGVPILAFRCVSLTAMNTIKYFDAAVSGENVYGITLQSIPDGAAGDIQVLGVVENAALAVLGATPGQDCYASQAGDGTFQTTPPDPILGQVVKVGLFEGPNLSVSGVATDILIEKVRLA